ARNGDVVFGEERLPARDQRMVEIAYDPEFVARRDRRTGGGQRWGIDLADIGRTELEALRGIDSDRVQELSPDEFDTRNERLRRLDIALNQRDAVDGILKISTAEMLINGGSRQQKPNAQTLPGTIVLEDDRIPKPPRRLRDVVLA